MKKTGKLFLILLGAGLSFGAAAESWNTPTPAPLPTQVQPRLNVQIGKETEEITFVNTNNDPFVYTKVYILKHADPYEIRPYIMSAIRSRRVDTNLTKVEAVKYADGTGMLIVSAEEYRFKPVENGMSIDAIVTELDKPDLKSEEGRKYFLYYPKYFDSISLAKLIRQVGMIRSGDSVELDGGIDAVHRHGAGGRHQHTVKQFRHGGFTAAVVAEQRHKRTLFNVEIDAVQDLAALSAV